MTTVIILALAVFIPPMLVALMIYAHHQEKQAWNNGVCPCNNKWQRFDVDSQGGRMYKCNHGCYTDISYPGID